MRARQLEVFCTLMRSGTVTGAAAMLNISQPALSQILLHTEDQLGFKLFDRVRGRLVPTQEAEELYAQAEHIFGELDALRRRTVDMRHGRTGLVRLAASAPPSMSIVPRALLAFREAHPDIVVRSLIASQASIIDMLRSGEVSLGITMNNLPHQGIVTETVGHADLVCVLPAQHRLAALDRIGFADIQAETLISYRADTLPGRLLAVAAETEGLAYAPAIEIDLSITALPFVRDGLGLAVVDGLLPWEQFNGIVARPFSPRIEVPIAIVTSKDRPLSASHEWMRDCLRAAGRDFSRAALAGE
ncbi:DNA-binding transcriptional LysR family regulator [Bosea sp. OAE752]|uniref:LysR family transcriptional regulator n=1 Tax=unclassified Bosea (in: a-proteobacteria) TaxID=2653178 RepID=UPI00056E9101|nr:LysR substrate-binding domain-containing protein [Bosea sp. UNC402CLCol]